MSLRVGLLGARADRGGLAAQTREFHRHLQPERTLVVDLGPTGRGQADLSWYPAATVSQGIPTADQVQDFAAGLDVVWAFETGYRTDTFDLVRDAGARSVLYANPELFHRDEAPPDVVLAPTGWRLDLLPGGTHVLPWPVALDRLPFRPRDHAATFMHVAAPAMCDRNGTRIVLNALRHVRHPCKLVITGYHAGQMPRRIGNVDIEMVNGSVGNYWEAWPDADVLLLPRRYAGLSLPMQEAMAMGMPVVSLDVVPQRAWLPPDTLIPSSGRSRQRMAGGIVDVHDVDPRRLAWVIDHLVGSPDLVRAASDAARMHAESISWDVMRPRYLAVTESAR